MKYLSQARCKLLAEDIFSTPCRVYRAKGREVIAAMAESREFRVIGYGIGWQAALDNALANAKAVIEKYGKEKENEFTTS